MTSFGRPDAPKWFVGRKEDSPVNHDLLWRSLIAKEKSEVKAMREAAQLRQERIALAKSMGLDVSDIDGRMSVRQGNPTRAPKDSLIPRRMGPAGTLILDEPAPDPLDALELGGRTGRTRGSRTGRGEDNANSLLYQGRSGEADEDDAGSLVYQFDPAFKSKKKGPFDYSATFTAADLLRKPPPAKRTPYWKRAAAENPHSKSGTLPTVQKSKTVSSSRSAASLSQKLPGLSARELRKIKLAKRVTREARQRANAELRAEKLKAKIRSLKEESKLQVKDDGMRRTMFDNMVKERLT